MLFKDRAQAGKQLAKALLGYKGQPCVVLALPRGGVVLGLEVAKALNVPLDLVIPRKIGHPLNPEYAIGAITEDGAAIWNQAELGRLDEHWIVSPVATPSSTMITVLFCSLIGSRPAR
jgi:putative phosphoribosyl transferase